MPAVRPLLARVARLEQTKIPAKTPFQRAYGSLEAFAERLQASMDAGTVDPSDGRHIVQAVRDWHEDRVWEVWQ